MKLHLFRLVFCQCILHISYLISHISYFVFCTLIWDRKSKYSVLSNAGSYVGFFADLNLDDGEVMASDLNGSASIKS